MLQILLAYIESRGHGKQTVLPWLYIELSSRTKLAT
jgi:hypothetical protein